MYRDLELMYCNLGMKLPVTIKVNDILLRHSLSQYMCHIPYSVKHCTLYQADGCFPKLSGQHSP